ncbi:MAG: hypothetical protein AUK47_13180 [Deltaproteobacteria bacterium CG2_30_63_29]|nr:MAG: hypothetical protein AUK47_13180 [Deltaproteobacteria bacterium CG2_30_63_29]PJB38918.1 MAG: hypothetical protein CO108_18225 [Deltaproteobacteria bacterium CG_4_9_14_3_um_filter_63_12]
MEADYKSGDVLSDRYLIDSVIGAGGMATVYRCNDMRLDMTVAIKVLRRQFRTQATVVQRFLREAKLQAKLRHPNIVQVTNIEEHGELTYMVMELLKGMPLDGYVQAKRGLDEAEALSLVVPIVDALAFAHRQEIVHRDVKPSNIFLAEQGRSLVPKLMDFGVARELDASITTANTLLGTLPYMSFELVQSARNASPASDVYAIGVTLFELLAGRFPVLGSTLQEYVFAMMELVEAPPLSSIGVQVSAETDAIIARCLRKDASERYLNCAELLEALQKVPGRAQKAASSVAPAPESFTERVEIGQGPAANVFHCVDREGKAFTLKEFDPNIPGLQPLLHSIASRQNEIAAVCPFVQTTEVVPNGVKSPRLDGQTLAAMLVSYGRFDPDYTLELYIRLADALRISHSRELLHGHLHLGNIFLAQQPDGVVTPMLMDFDHLSVLGERALVKRGTSLPFCAPELGGGHPPTPACDIFSFGICMFFTLTGKLPIHSTNLIGWRQEVAALGAIPNAREFVPELSEDLSKVLGWCLSLAPAARYLDVSEVHRDLLAVRLSKLGY